jgi:hypothetical protein
MCSRVLRNCSTQAISKITGSRIGAAGEEGVSENILFHGSKLLKAKVIPPINNTI